MRKPLVPATVTAVLAALALGAPLASAALRSFQSPSGNIGCVMTSGDIGVQARCDIAQHTWRASAKPRSCPLDWGNGVFVAASGRGRYVCAGDTTLHSGGRLAYGHSIRLGRLSCTSLQSGVRCTNRSTRHGFSLARTTLRLF